MLDRFNFFWFTLILESLDNNCELLSNPYEVLEISIVLVLEKNTIFLRLVKITYVYQSVFLIA